VAGRWLAKDVAAPAYETAEDVIRAIYAGKYKSNCLIPVKPGPFQEVLGAAVWVCADEAVAEKIRRGRELVFTVPEFLLVVETAKQGADALRGIIEAKRQFCGAIMKEGGQYGQAS